VDNQELIRELCQQAEKEDDPKKLLKLPARSSLSSVRIDQKATPPAGSCNDMMCTTELSGRIAEISAADYWSTSQFRIS
jgi:hypothetical protein